MKLKKTLTFLGLLTCASCANQSQPFYIEKFFALGPNCDTSEVDEAPIAANGYLDVAAGGPQFFVGVRISGADKVLQNEVKVGTSSLEPANRDRPVVNQQVVTYRLSRSLGARPKPYLTNLVFSFSDKGQIFGPIQLISAELGQQLVDGLEPSKTVDGDTDFVDISADVEFKGQFSNSKNAFSTGVLTFPIRAFRSDPQQCTGGYLRFPNGDFCNYTGQAASQLLAPSPPTCCSVGTPGC